jgi:hypothetical protein
MFFAAVIRLAKGISPETLVTLKVEKSLICLAGTRRLTASLIEQTVGFVLENLNKK